MVLFYFSTRKDINTWRADRTTPADFKRYCNDAHLYRALQGLLFAFSVITELSNKSVVYMTIRQRVSIAWRNKRTRSLLVNVGVSVWRQQGEAPGTEETTPMAFMAIEKHPATHTETLTKPFQPQPKSKLKHGLTNYHLRLQYQAKNAKKCSNINIHRLKIYFKSFMTR